MAHGISGPLALLSLAMRRGIVTDGQAEAIKRICSWLDTWRQDHDTGPWWPETITLEGSTGLALALSTAAIELPAARWDTCLLLASAQR